MMPCNTRPATPRRHAQRGAALLLAMIIVALVATLSVSMVWQQWRAVQVEAAERARAQSAWVLAGALDWSRIILREDLRTGGADHLGEPWAVPLAEARLSTFLAADKDNTDTGPEAFLSGDISDAQGRYNLANLVQDPALFADELKVLQRLCSNVGVTPETATQIANQLRVAQATTAPPPNQPPVLGQPLPAVQAAPDGPLMPDRLGQLAWLGIAPEALQRLEPYVILLPVATKVNLNTAPREVIAAVINGLDVGGAERLVQIRQRTPFKQLDDVERHLAGQVPDPQRTDVKSSFFIVRGRLRLGDHALEQRSLVQRLSGGNRQVVALTRESITTVDLSTALPQDR